MSVYRLEIDVIEGLMRIYYLAKRVAKTVAEQVEEELDIPVPEVA